jgi:uncharacterized protein DUF6647
MPKSRFLATIFFAALLIGSANVMEAARADGRPSGEPEPAQIFDFATVFPEREQSAAAVSPTLLAEISSWLTENFDLSVVGNQPTVKLVPPAHIGALRYRNFVNPQTYVPAADRAPGEIETVAVYDNVTETIYLPQGWTGRTPTELSVLVHEMVHHLQKQGNLKYNCPQQRERLAFVAQARWLERHGLTLEDEFGINPFTLLVRTNCI